jgi:hypothetical protein
MVDKADIDGGVRANRLRYEATRERRDGGGIWRTEIRYGLRFLRYGINLSNIRNAL